MIQFHIRNRMTDTYHRKPLFETSKAAMKSRDRNTVKQRHLIGTESAASISVGMASGGRIPSERTSLLRITTQNTLSSPKNAIHSSILDTRGPRTSVNANLNPFTQFQRVVYGKTKRR